MAENNKFSRRAFVQVSAGIATLATSKRGLSAFEVQSGSPNRSASNDVLIATLSVPWTESIPLFGDVRLTAEETVGVPISPTGFSDRETSLKPSTVTDVLIRKRASVYCDFALAKDRRGRWHCIGDEFLPGADDIPVFHHHVADKLTGPYRRVGVVRTGAPVQPPFTLTACSPYIIFQSANTANMYYGHDIGRKGDEKFNDSSLRVLVNRNGLLDHWQPGPPQAAGGNLVFRDRGARDAMILWDQDRRIYILYYSRGNGWIDPASECGLRVRTSPDLKIWSDYKLALQPPPGYQNLESSFCVKKDGFYYLWVCGFDWGRMSLYISEDPFNFGDPVKNRISEWSGHTPEIVVEDGQYWMACAGISTQMGRPWGFCDLLGTYIQPLKWSKATEEQVSRIHWA